jgi:hypothetical protein
VVSNKPTAGGAVRSLNREETDKTEKYMQSREDKSREDKIAHACVDLRRLMLMAFFSFSWGRRKEGTGGVTLLGPSWRRYGIIFRMSGVVLESFVMSNYTGFGCVIICMSDSK